MADAPKNDTAPLPAPPPPAKPAPKAKDAAPAPAAPPTLTVNRHVNYNHRGRMHAAIVTAVHDDGRVNLAVFDPSGETITGRTRVEVGDGEGQCALPLGK